MANSMGTLSRRLWRSLLSNSRPSSHYLSAKSMCTTGTGHLSSDEAASESETDSVPPLPQQSSPSQESDPQQRMVYDRPLENGLDVGIYKAIVVGQVGQSPFQKKLRSGTTVTLLSVGTGGIRNNRRPLDNEDPREYANRCAVQWHRVSVYPEKLGGVVMKHVVPGTILYLEGNLETKIFTDPTTGFVRRIREIAIRRNGRIVFVGNGGDAQKPSLSELKSVGYY
ncbi:single-stranded DNA-binding protein, mitochondrial [Juglans microcarpa x Juglans regia]|uniref:single-stranded DNA-binding protein, mitochondrial n=1 Tax=Juglans microcarpa x Juglans regia TaxID=2249226 RepID=UPI001B7E4CEE|nr:single-stranded DNA-binding protein, mitochondrial [Juglans microcarpa x Juglans regia]